jgi:hypothetical protein
MAVIKVPKTPKKSFDKDRSPSALLLDQIAHLEWAALPASQRRAGRLPRPKVKTEGQAAERIAQLTKFVLANEAARAEAARSVDALPPTAVKLPPLPRVPAPAGTSGRGASKAAVRTKRPANRSASRRRARR